VKKKSKPMIRMRAKNRGHREKAKCGLCGKTKKLMKTECCDNWICDDYDQYVMFSFARNSCARNHDRYTLCGYHYHEGHQGDWEYDTALELCRGKDDYQIIIDKLSRKKDDYYSRLIAELHRMMGDEEAS